MSRRSTAIEVALKMAFRLYQVRHAAALNGAAPRPLHVLALSNGYHGDTLGAMACAEASVFNARQTPWYAPRGLFLPPPTAGLVRGKWTVRTAGVAAIHGSHCLHCVHGPVLPLQR